jgi:hypothetical protein
MSPPTSFGDDFDVLTGPIPMAPQPKGQGR